MSIGLTFVTCTNTQWRDIAQALRHYDMLPEIVTQIEEVCERKTDDETWNWCMTTEQAYTIKTVMDLERRNRPAAAVPRGAAAGAE